MRILTLAVVAPMAVVLLTASGGRAADPKTPGAAPAPAGPGPAAPTVTGPTTITCPDSVNLEVKTPPGWLSGSVFFPRAFVKISLAQPTNRVVVCSYENMPGSSLGPIIDRAAPEGTVCEIEGARKAVCKPVPR